MTTLPWILLQALEPLGVRGALWTLARAAILTQSVIRRGARPTDDVLMRAAKRRLAFAVTVKEVMGRRLGVESGEALARSVLLAVACHLQRRMYTPSGGSTSSDEFHARHLAEMCDGSIRVNEHGPIEQREDRVAFSITCCRFFEALRDMGAPDLCQSDEIVFNEILPATRFDRGGRQPDTIARGATECAFVFTRRRP